MLNLSSPSEQILKEVLEGQDKAIYWHKKIRFKKTVSRQLNYIYEKAYKNEKTYYTGFNTTYDSPLGNKWYTFEIIFPVDEECFAVKLCSFIYYETIGSIGCFIPTGNPDNKEEWGVSIYTSHFFRRYSERTGVEYNSLEMLQQFATDSLLLAATKVKDNHGEHEVFRIPYTGLCMAMPRKDSYRVCEVRTFIPDNTLSSSQYNRYREFIKEVDSYSNPPTHKLVDEIVITC